MMWGQRQNAVKNMVLDIKLTFNFQNSYMEGSGSATIK